MFKFAKGINSKNAKALTKNKRFFLNFHQVIHSLPSISCPTLELLAVTVFEISSLLSKFAKGNNSKIINDFFYFHQVVFLLN